jgi:tetratricopeptide (TPR) repeat protein
MVDIGHLGCVRSGLCCQRAACAYGEAGDDGTRYAWILANVRDWRAHPAFGAGCSAPLFNPNRAAILNAKGLDRSVAAEPSEAELARAFVRARDCQENGRLAEAEALYRGILVARPDHAPALHRLGQIARAARQLDYAVWLFERALAAGGPAAAIEAERGAVLHEDRHYEAAAAAFARAADLAPDEPRHRLREAEALSAAGHADRAAALLAALVAAHPDLAEARWSLALAQRARAS